MDQKKGVLHAELLLYIATLVISLYLIIWAMVGENINLPFWIFCCLSCAAFGFQLWKAFTNRTAINRQSPATASGHPHGKLRVIFSFIFILPMLFLWQNGYFLRTSIVITVNNPADGNARIYYDTGRGFREADSSAILVKRSDKPANVKLYLPQKTVFRLRIDPGYRARTIFIQKICLQNFVLKRCWTGIELIKNFKALDQISKFRLKKDRLQIVSTGKDPSFIYKRNFKILYDNLGLLPPTVVLSIIFVLFSLFFLLFPAFQRFLSLADDELKKGEWMSRVYSNKRILIKSSVFFLPIAIFAVSYWLMNAHRGLFLYLAQEDGIVEHLQLYLFITSALLSIWLVQHLIRTAQYGWAMLYLIVAIGLVFVSGEEISWGQRIFNFTTPQELTSQNLQGEFNLHNLRSFRKYVHFGVLLLSVLGTSISIFGWLLTRKTYLQRKFYFWIPHPVLIPGIFSILVYMQIRKAYTGFQEINDPAWFAISRLQEPVELNIALSVLFFLVAVIHGDCCRRRQGAVPATKN